MRLADGGRVVIVGGGPAGSLSAIHLLRLAQEAALRLQVIVFEAADFGRCGRPGCNMCAGILSSQLVRHLNEQGLQLPPEVIQAEVNAYVLHVGNLELRVSRSDPERRIFTVFRGRGPREGGQPRPASFDGWLLDQARARGAQARQARVRSVLAGPRPVVVTGDESLEADLVVIATGVNSRSPLAGSWGYRPPRTETMAQDEGPGPSEFAPDVVHVFFGYPPGLLFGAVIPKGRYASVSLLGRSLSPDAVADFLEGHGLRSLLPGDRAQLCGCWPRVAVSPARRFFADRMVVVGDAAVTRLYKDGIGAAALTAEAASRTAVQQGLSRGEFAQGYAPVCRRIAADGRYGRLCFALWDLTRRVPALLRGWQQAILAESDLPAAGRPHMRILWGMFTGDMSYRQIFWLSVSPRALSGLARGVLSARRP
jgi:flavin-dependent dehydrogenase